MLRIPFSILVASQGEELDAALPQLKEGGLLNPIFLKTAGSGASDYYSAHALGPDGSIYGTGHLSEPIDFGNGVIADEGGIFIVKYSSDGIPLQVWSLGNDYSHILDLFVDKDENFYYHLFRNPNLRQTKLVKRDASFQLLWEIEFEDFSVGILNFSPDGYILTSGYLENQASVRGKLFHNLGEKDLINLMFDSNGNLVWSQQESASVGAISGKGIAKSESHYYGVGTFGERLRLGQFALSKGSSLDYFLMEMDFDREITAVVDFRLGFPGWLYNGIVLDEDGGLYIVGEFGGEVEIGSTTLKSEGSNQNGLIAKFGKGLNHEWSQIIEVEEGDLGNLKRLVDTHERLFVMGTFSGTLRIHNKRIRTDDIRERVWFVATFNSSTGQLLDLAKQRSSQVYSIIDPLVDSYGDLVFAGSYSGNLIFDNKSHYSLGGNNLVIGKFKPVDSVINYTIDILNLKHSDLTDCLIFDVCIDPRAAVVLEQFRPSNPAGWIEVESMSNPTGIYSFEVDAGDIDSHFFYRARVDIE